MTNQILLTGAGFTKNFGAPLADEVSDFIFNDSGIQANQRFRALLQDNHDYEDIYQKIVQSSDFNEIEKNIFTEAVRAAYKDVDNQILYGKLQQTNFDMFDKLIKRFGRERGGSGFIFTLYQDLFIERMGSDDPSFNIVLPGASSNAHSSSVPLGCAEEEKRIFISNEVELNNLKNKYGKKLNQINLSYIKLHGSQEWFAKDTHQAMIIGGDKAGQISGIPLLKWYFELFRTQLNVANTKILIIGYGFKDRHINAALHNIDKDKNLKIYVIDVKSKKDFMSDLIKPEILHGDQIRNLICGYYARPMYELFPNEAKNHHPDWDKIRKEFFDDTV